MDRRVWNAPPPFRILHPKALEVMKAPPRACYNFVTLAQGYDKLDGPWTRALVDRARRETTNVVWAARRACCAAVLRSVSRRAPPSARFRCTLNGFRCWTPSSAGLILRACAVAGATHAWLMQTRLTGMRCGYRPCAAVRRRRGCRGVAGADAAASPLLLMAMMESV
jgi:hypothetical protein